jgi:hypothetical protein
MIRDVIWVITYAWIHLLISAAGWCCYITVDPETRASVNVICLTQQESHIMILFHNCSRIKDESNQNEMFLVQVCMPFRIHRCVAAPLWKSDSGTVRLFGLKTTLQNLFHSYLSIIYSLDRFYAAPLRPCMPPSPRCMPPPTPLHASPLPPLYLYLANFPLWQALKGPSHYSILDCLKVIYCGEWNHGAAEKKIRNLLMTTI